MMNSPVPTSENSIEVREKINSGCFGEIWQGYQKSLDRIVAVKIIKPEMLSRADVLQHAKILAKVEHPNVVIVHEVTRLPFPNMSGLHECIVMEWIDGDTLGDRLTKEKFSRVEALEICKSILDGLTAIHDKGIVHGDLHDRNILFSANNTVKIIDIGYDRHTSLNRLSVQSRDSYIQTDVEFVSHEILRILHHSHLDLTRYDFFPKNLRNARTLEEINTNLTRLDEKSKQSRGTKKRIRLSQEDNDFLMDLFRHDITGCLPKNLPSSSIANDRYSVAKKLVSRKMMAETADEFNLTANGMAEAKGLWQNLILKTLNRVQDHDGWTTVASLESELELESEKMQALIDEMIILKLVIQESFNYRPYIKPTYTGKKQFESEIEL